VKDQLQNKGWSKSICAPDDCAVIVRCTETFWPLCTRMVFLNVISSSVGRLLPIFRDRYYFHVPPWRWRQYIPTRRWYQAASCPNQKDHLRSDTGYAIYDRREGRKQMYPRKRNVRLLVNNLMSCLCNVDLAATCFRNTPLLESVVAAMLSYGRGGCCGVARVMPPIASDDPGDKATWRTFYLLRGEKRSMHGTVA